MCPQTCISRISLFCLYLVLALSLTVTAYAQPVSVAEGKSALIVAMLEHTTWPDEASIDEFIIGLYGRDDELFSVLKRKVDNLKIRAKPVVVTYYGSVSRARASHLLVVANERNRNLPYIIDGLRQSHTLVVTDGHRNQREVMINFTHPADDILTFEINRSNVIDEGLNLSKQILLFGGSEVDKALVYQETEAELTGARQRLREQQLELQEQQALLAEQRQKIEQQSSQIASKESRLKNLEQSLDGVTTTLARTKEQLEENTAELTQKEAILSEKEAAIDEYSARIQDNLAMLEEQRAQFQRQQAEIDEKERLIAQKNAELMEQIGTIEAQQLILTLLGIASLAVLTLVAVILRGYRIKLRLNKQLKAKTEELEEANTKLLNMTDAKSQFLSTMSHEIRTPLNGVFGMAELLESTELTRQQSEYVSIILKSADTLLSLINDILDISKIEAGKLELESIAFNIRETLGDTLQTLALRANEKGLELAFHIPPEVPEYLMGDPVRLQQIVVNLVGNAIKFTEEGEIVVDLRPDSVTGDKARIAIEVRDTGIGISEEQRKKIFEAFGQADSTITRQFGGTGLGVTIASQLVAMMGGELTVDSELGEGSTFSFTLEFSIADKPQTPARQPGEIRGKRALVVDDNSTNRMIFEELLSSWGMEVTTVDSGTKALDALDHAHHDNTPYDLALLDVIMPGMDGFDLAARIRKDSANDPMRVLILSSAGYADSETRISELDISRILLKPVKHSDLLSAITEALGIAVVTEDKSALEKIPADMQARKVLLVEDGKINQKVATDLLVKRGHSVSLAENGEAALEAIENDTFDVVLMDIQMPVMDGYTATREIRKREREGHIPIIAMTASATTEDRTQCLEAGMDGFVAKPFRAADLFKAVEDATPSPAAAETAPPADDKAPSEHPEKEANMTSKKPEQNDESGTTPSGETPRAAPDETDVSALDWQSALDAVEDNEELLTELGTMFLEQYPTLLTTIKSSLASGDAQELRRAAHTLKSSAKVIGAKDVGDTALAVEELARDNELDKVEQALEALESALSRVEPALKATLQK